MPALPPVLHNDTENDENTDRIRPRIFESYVAKFGENYRKENTNV